MYGFSQCTEEWSIVLLRTNNFNYTEPPPPPPPPPQPHRHLQGLLGGTHWFKNRKQKQKNGKSSRNKHYVVSHTKMIVGQSDVCGKKGLTVSASPCFQGEQPFWHLCDWSLGLESIVQRASFISQDGPWPPEDLQLMVYVCHRQSALSQSACLQSSLLDAVWRHWRSSSCWRSTSCCTK